LPLKLIGEVILPGKGVFLIVIVGIAAAIALVLHQARRRIEDVLGRQQRAMLFRHAARGAIGGVTGIGFGRGRDIEHGLCDRKFALGVTEEYRTTGVAAGFYATLVRNALKLGYDGACEMSWILEDNVLMNRSAELMGVRRYKTYRIYEWN